jgi:hypothetical protein
LYRQRKALNDGIDGGGRELLFSEGIDCVIKIAAIEDTG